MKDDKLKKYKILFTSGVIAAIITGVFSLVVSIETNNKLEKIETQKYQYGLYEIRYEKLQEYLEFFSKFEICDSKYFYGFDISSDEYSIEGIIKIIYDSDSEFKSKLNLLSPYLSDGALKILEKEVKLDVLNLMLEQFISKLIGSVSFDSNDKHTNDNVKNCLKVINEYYAGWCASAIKVIKLDIHNEYVL
ncbi:hypothetical protein D7V86_23945 [bacterium D16-51]|nr:hypothetical protein D7V96_24135 [bacterium D16-59]RKI54196.1 hypothetical protein D7V86_23945 [bacterium D16-51]